MTARKAELLRSIRRLKRIAAEAEPFPTIPQVDAMLSEVRCLPQIPQCAELADLLLSIRRELAAQPAAGCAVSAAGRP